MKSPGCADESLSSGDHAADAHQKRVNRIDNSVRIFLSIDDGEDYADEIHTLSSAFIKVVIQCPGIDLDHLGWELRVHHLLSQWRRGISSMHAEAKQAIQNAMKYICDA